MAQPMNQKTNFPADGLGEQAKQTASNVARGASEQVSRQIDVRKDKAVETMGNVAQAIRQTTSTLKEAGPVGDLADRAADGIERVATFFEGKNVGQLASDVERFARREPAIFLGAAFALGLIGGRFLKSSARKSQQDFGGYDDDRFLSPDDLQDDIEPSVRPRVNTLPGTGRP